MCQEKSSDIICLKLSESQFKLVDRILGRVEDFIQEYHSLEKLLIVTEQEIYQAYEDIVREKKIFRVSADELK